jgi:serine/threonine-protein phosphatase 2A regulatory subunit B''
VRKFFFFLDPKKTGKIYIKDMLCSPILAELYDLRQDKSMEELMQNWFSSQNAQRVYEAYLRLDTDQNGLLTKKELSQFQWGITDLFIDRIFEEYQTFEGEMDYKTFLDFVLAMENKKSPQALAYFWKILDIYGKGAIDTFVINMFFKRVLDKLNDKDPDAEKNFQVEDIKDEIFDMAKPETPMAITLEDLINCG